MAWPRPRTFSKHYGTWKNSTVLLPVKGGEYIPVARNVYVQLVLRS